jgi:hypothetical protein
LHLVANVLWAVGGGLIYPFLLFLDGWQRVACFCRRANRIDFE